MNGPFAKDAVDAKLAEWSEQITPFVEEGAGLKGAPNVERWKVELLELRYVLQAARGDRGHRYAPP